MKPKIQSFDCVTGQITEREMTEEERAELENAGWSATGNGLIDPITGEALS